MNRFIKTYLIGTEVQDKNGRVKKKISAGDGNAKWVGRARYNYMREYKEDLTENHRVFHKNGDLADDDPKNLVAIKFSGVRYHLVHSRVVYFPKAQPAVPRERKGALARV